MLQSISARREYRRIVYHPAELFDVRTIWTDPAPQIEAWPILAILAGRIVRSAARYSSDAFRPHPACCRSRHRFSSGVLSFMSGHSKWSTIKRQKGAADAKRGQLFTKLAREITVAARSGVPDPDANARLRIAVQKAKKESMPKDNIDRAIARAAGSEGGDQYDEIFYEGYGPGGTALMISTLTDNRNRTVGEVRAILTRAGGSLAENGAVSWMFDQTGVITLPAGNADPDEIALVAIDAGATDFQVEDETVEIYTEPTDLHKVQDQLVAAGYEPESAELIMKPKTSLQPDADAAVKAIRLLEKLEDLDDVQQVYSNLDISDDVLAAVS
jgi:YebC/PmpR family DNA-binding regulatory protein